MELTFCFQLTLSLTPLTSQMNLDFTCIIHLSRCHPLLHRPGLRPVFRAVSTCGLFLQRCVTRYDSSHTSRMTTEWSVATAKPAGCRRASTFSSVKSLRHWQDSPKGCRQHEEEFDIDIDEMEEVRYLLPQSAMTAVADGMTN